MSCEFTITVVDTTAPVINEITASPSALWPPNHKMRTVEVTVDAEDVCGEVTSKVIEVSSNEPVNDIGDGNTKSDWEILGDLEVDLRAERAGPFNGRVYTLTVEVTDEAGNATIGTTEVTVGHSLGRGSAFGRFFRRR